MGRARTRWRDETFDDRRAVESDKPDLSVGQRVFHQKFGYGRIVAVDGNKLDIEFEKAGPRRCWTASSRRRESLDGLDGSPSGGTRSA
jgi:DNA helicase II / ATP-dependent DNA helicase PcrA